MTAMNRTDINWQEFQRFASAFTFAVTALELGLGIYVTTARVWALFNIARNRSRVEDIEQGRQNLQTVEGQRLVNMLVTQMHESNQQLLRRYAVNIRNFQREYQEVPAGQEPPPTLDAGPELGRGSIRAALRRLERRVSNIGSRLNSASSRRVRACVRPQAE